MSPAWLSDSIGDFNGDAKTDHIWRNYSTGETVMWLMDGTTVAGAAALPGLSRTWDNRTFGNDYNGDGKGDILRRNYSTGENAMWLMDGTTVAGAASIPGSF